MPELIADVSGDGKLDLINIGAQSTQVEIRRGIGNGAFEEPTYVSLPVICPADADCQITDFQTGDFNNDGRLDIAVLAVISTSASSSSVVYVLKNDGRGTFSLAAPPTSLPDAYYAMAIADLNGDQKPDLVLSSFDHSVGGSFALGDGQGGFGSIQSLGSSFTGTSILLTRDLGLTSRQDIVGGTVPYEPLLGPTPIAINTTSYTGCIPPSAARLAAIICSPRPGLNRSNSIEVKASGDSPAGVQRLEVWIDGKKRGQRWADQLTEQFTLTSGVHQITVVAVDKFTGYAKSSIHVRVN